VYFVMSLNIATVGEVKEVLSLQTFEWWTSVHENDIHTHSH
jgi:hypothetical protein